jgi:hypothetical protein
MSFFFSRVKFDRNSWVGEWWVSRDADETIARVPIFTLSNQKLKELGINFQPIEDVFQEAVTSFKECGWLA